MNKFTRQLKLSLAALAACGIASSASAATTIDFDSTPTGTYSLLTFGSVNITFLAGDGTFNVSNDTPDLPVSGHSLLSFFTNPGSGSFQATFAGGVSSVSIDVSDYSPSDDDEPSLYAYDSVGTLLDSDSILIPGGGPGGTLSVSSLTPIAYVQWNEVGSFAGAVYWDNLVYAPIPEPETYAMLLAGLGLLGFAARRRKESAV